MNRSSFILLALLMTGAVSPAPCAQAAPARVDRIPDALVSSSQATTPVIDGNLDDMIAYAESLQSSGVGCGSYFADNPTVNGDPLPETIYSDTKFIPCATPQPILGSHWANGVEIFWEVFAYARGSTIAYLGLRTEGFVGDSDGNGNPDNSGGDTCNPADNIDDPAGISGNEHYTWSFDLNCDGSVDGRILVQDNAVTGTGLLAGITGTIAFRQDPTVGASGKDLEVQINLLAPLPDAFHFVGVESDAFDGVTEDSMQGMHCIGNPKIAVLNAAEPLAVCVGEKTRLLVTIQNTGGTSLSVDAVDQIPAGLSYAGGLAGTCGAGEPIVTGNQLTFPAFSLAAGASCTIAFDALAGPECFGEVVNHVDVLGTYSSPCSPEGGPYIIGASAEFAVVCKGQPCVSECVVPSTIKSNFNGIAIVGAADGPEYIWFNSNLRVRGMTAGKSIFLTGSSVLINGVPHDVPNAKITFADVSCAATVFDVASNTWMTTVPLAGNNEIFLSGLALPVTNLPGGASVEWQGTFGTDQPGICLSWRWGAAAYETFTLLNGDPLAIDYNAANIKPTHRAACLISNGDHAGTPQNAAIQASVTGGAKGGGGSNFTGSWSGTGSACPVCPPDGSSVGSGQLPIVLHQGLALPREFSFTTPTPNPTVGASLLRFALPRDASISLRAYSVTGRMVRELVNGTVPAGTHTVTWDLLDRNGERVPSGVYFLRFEAEGRVLLQSLSVAR